MAKYKEVRAPYEGAPLAGYYDNETRENIPLSPGSGLYQMVLEWIAEGNTADPAYTAEEIAAFEAAETAAEASNYVAATSDQATSYTERKAAGLPGKINSLKYKHLRRRRGLALGRV